MRNLQEIGFPISALREISEKLREQSLPVRTYCKNVILMDAKVDLAAPNETTAELVEISALGKNDIATQKTITFDFGSTNADFLHLG